MGAEQQPNYASPGEVERLQAAGEKLAEYLENLPEDSKPSPEEASQGLILKDIIEQAQEKLG